MSRPVRYERVKFYVETESAEWTVSASVRSDGGDTQLEYATCDALTMDASDFGKTYAFSEDDLRDKAWDALCNEFERRSA